MQLLQAKIAPGAIVVPWKSKIARSRRSAEQNWSKKIIRYV